MPNTFGHDAGAVSNLWGMHGLVNKYWDMWGEIPEKIHKSGSHSHSVSQGISLDPSSGSVSPEEGAGTEQITCWAQTHLGRLVTRVVL